MAAPICYLNGEFLPLAQAKVSALDRGFIFGDAAYEVLIANAGRMFALAEHLARLERSLTAVAIANPQTAAKCGSLLRQLVADNGAGDQSIYVQVTRGVAERDHGFSPGITPTVLAMSRTLVAKPGTQRVDAHRGRGQSRAALRHQIDLAAAERVVAQSGRCGRRLRSDPGPRRLHH